MRPCFAGLNTLVPRVMKFRVTRSPAISEPRTTAATAAHFPRFLDSTAVRAYGNEGRCYGCWCSCMKIGERKNRLTLKSLLSSQYTYAPTYPSPRALDLRLQTSKPSNHLWSTFLLPTPPQFLNQAPLGAQQLTRPDFSNIPQFGHAFFVTIEVMADVLVRNGVETMSSRLGFGRRVIC